MVVSSHWLGILLSVVVNYFSEVVRFISHPCVSSRKSWTFLVLALKNIILGTPQSWVPGMFGHPYFRARRDHTDHLCQTPQFVNGKNEKQVRVSNKVLEPIGGEPRLLT